MDKIIARCGFQCDACMAFNANNKTSADQEKVAAAWSKYFGLKMSPYKIRCNGCFSEPSPACDLPARDCQIRACVMERGMMSCADCFDYPCKELEARMKNIDETMEQFRGKIPLKDFDNFIAPYDSRTTLNEIRERRVERID